MIFYEKVFTVICIDFHVAKLSVRGGNFGFHQH
jgi:hypothetical protein